MAGNVNDFPFRVVFEAIRALMTPPEKKRQKIGFLREEGIKGLSGWSGSNCFKRTISRTEPVLYF